MKIIIFRLFEGIYLRSYLFDDKALVLSGFLTDDVGGDGIIFKKFINDPNKKETSSNYCFLEKEGEDIFIGCQFDEDPYENGIKMSQNELISLLDQWDRLMDQDSQEIIVFKKGDTYRLEGHSFPDKQ